MLAIYENMIVNTTATKYLTGVNISCGEGYNFSDKSGEAFKEYVCGSTGEWEPELSLCAGMT